MIYWVKCVYIAKCILNSAFSNLELRMLRPALQHSTKSLRNNWDQCGCSRFSLPAQPQTSHSWEPDLGSPKAIYSQSSNTKSSQAGASRKGQWILELLHPQNPFSRESGLLCWALCSCPVNAAHLASKVSAVPSPHLGLLSPTPELSQELSLQLLTCTWCFPQ